MRRSLLAFVLLASSALGGMWVWTPGKGSHAAAGSPPAAFSDDFSGTLSNWTTDAGSWAINVGVLSQQSTSYFEDNIHYNTACATANQYIKFTIVDQNGGFLAARFRVTGMTSYYIWFTLSTSNVEWYDGGGNLIQSSTAMAYVNGSVLGITVEGTGTNTVFRLWLNPTGLPTSTSNWNGDTTPDLSFTNNPTTAVDSGSYVGFAGANSSGTGTGADNFFGGDAP